ncbi:MAG: M55 family metallopeptidase [Gemmatimonadales bacterium]|nr:M55 family metallopeptidase [Gemmatimonadales bacterium]
MSARALALALWCAAAAAPADAQKLKVHISVDMEGIAGVVTDQQLGPAGFEYQAARAWMTEELLAAIAGARDAGATEIVIADSHGNGQNLLLDRLPPDVTVIRSWPRPLGMMEGIDSTVDAALFVGYHASTANPAGVRAHTSSSANYAGMQLNGVEVPEGGLNAAIAGHFRVPVVFVSGDDQACDEVRRLAGDMEAAVVKRAISFHAAATMTPEAARALIRQKAKRGVERRRELRPYVMKGPVRLDLTFKNYRPAEVLAFLPNVQRTASHAIRFTGKDIIEVSRFLQFVGAYEPGLAP